MPYVPGISATIGVALPSVIYVIARPGSPDEETARATRSRVVSPPKVRFAMDSPLKGTGFEFPVPRQIGNGFKAPARWV
jgi:hypothetical protein